MHFWLSFMILTSFVSLLLPRPFTSPTSSCPSAGVFRGCISTGTLIVLLDCLQWASTFVLDCGCSHYHSSRFCRPHPPLLIRDGCPQLHRPGCLACGVLRHHRSHRRFTLSTRASLSLLRFQSWKLLSPPPNPNPKPPPAVATTDLDPDDRETATLFNSGSKSLPSVSQSPCFFMPSSWQQEH